MSQIAGVCGGDVRLAGALQLAEDRASRNALGAIMAGQAAADHLRVVHHCYRFEQIGVVARIAGIGSGDVGGRFADRRIVVVAGHAFASEARLGVIRLGIGHPGCSADMAIFAILRTGVEDRMRCGPRNSIWFASIMASRAFLCSQCWIGMVNMGRCER